MIGIHSITISSPAIITSYKSWDARYKKNTIGQGMEVDQGGNMDYSQTCLFASIYEYVQDESERDYLLQQLKEGLSGFKYHSKDLNLLHTGNYNFRELLEEVKEYLGDELEISWKFRKSLEEAEELGFDKYPMTGCYKDGFPYMIDIDKALNSRNGFVDTRGVYEIKRFYADKVYPLILVLMTNLPELISHQKYTFGVMTEEQLKLSMDQLDVELKKYGLEFGISWAGTKINKIHIYKDIEVSRPFQDYIPLFERLRMKHQRNSLSLFGNEYIYKNKKREIAIYDKMKHLRDKKTAIPEEWKGKNVIRVEYRINNSKDLKCIKFDGIEFSDYYSYFEAIFKEQVLGLFSLKDEGGEEFRTPSSDFDELMRRLIDRGESPMKAIRLFMGMTGTSSLIDADGGLHETLVHIKTLTKEINQYNYIKKFIESMSDLAIELGYSGPNTVSLRELLEEIRSGVQNDLKTVPFQGTIGGIKGTETVFDMNEDPFQRD